MKSSVLNFFVHISNKNFMRINFRIWLEFPVFLGLSQIILFLSEWNSSRTVHLNISKWASDKQSSCSNKNIAQLAPPLGF